MVHRKETASSKGASLTSSREERIVEDSGQEGETRTQVGYGAWGTVAQLKSSDFILGII